MKVVAVVVTFNGAKWIHKCLESLRASAYPVETIVVDNGSSDDTEEIIRQCFKEVEFISAGKNLGFGAGNNLGIRSAIKKNADYVFLLNQDAWIETGTLGSLVEVANEQREYAILSPLHYNGDGTLLDQRFFEQLHIGNRELLTDLLNGNPKTHYEVHFENAAAWLVRLSSVREVGLFDPVFFHYGEDLNFVRRCQHFSYKIGVVLQTKIWHDREDKLKESKTEVLEFRRMRIDWALKMTDLSLTNWPRGYKKQLAIYIAKAMIRHPSSRRNILAATLPLWRMKKEIGEARERMKRGFPAYEGLAT